MTFFFALTNLTNKILIFCLLNLWKCVALIGRLFFCQFIAQNLSIANNCNKRTDSSFTVVQAGYFCR